MNTKKGLHVTPINSASGRIKNYIHEWKKLAQYPTISVQLSGYEIPFHSQVFRTYRQPNRHCSNKEFNIRTDIISQLASQGAIFERTFSQFISDIFLTRKFTGGYRLILNSKKLNEFINIKLEIQRVAPKFSSTVLSIL